jgi:hypothetical protein
MPFDLDWLRQTVVENKIYFSNPAMFNDPWDCRPHFSIPDDADGRERNILWLDQASRKRSESVDERRQQTILHRLRTDDEFFRLKMREFSEGMAGAIAAEYRVYCLSDKPDSQLMWSHYARNHTGVCLEFQCRNAVFGTAVKVQYQRSYPKFDLATGDDEGILPLVTKAADWSYEGEFRVIAREGASEIPDIIRTRKNLCRISSDALMSVIVGCSMLAEDAAAIGQLVKQQIGRKIALKRAVRSLDRYELNIEQLL